MGNRLPTIQDKHKICIVCEGYEDYAYLDKLNSLDVWNDQYDITLDNAKGNGNIPARYQNRYQNGDFELVLIFCDTEKKPYEQYEDIKRKINEFHGVENAANELIIYANPCTMQIIIKHFMDAEIKKAFKSANVTLIKEATGVDNYKAKEEQINELMSLISEDNYMIMLERAQKLCDDDSIVGSSNFGKFMKLLEMHECGWIKEINAKLDEFD